MINRAWSRWIGWSIVLVSIVLAGTIRGSDTQPLYAICAAYPPEIAALHREFGVNRENGFTRTTINGLEFWRGAYRGKEIVVFRAGVSVVNAAYMLQLALDRFPITHVFFAGVAGGIDPALKIGDVVIPDRWVYHDEAVYLNPDGQGGYVVPEDRPLRYENFGMIFPNDVAVTREGDEKPDKIPAFAADPKLLEAARRAVPKIPPQRKAGRDVDVIVGGTGVAGSVFLDNAEYRDWVYRVWRARCVDMESTALAHVAYANRKPILIVRGLSDLAGAQHGHNPIEANEAQVSEIAARVLRAVIDAL